MESKVPATLRAISPPLGASGSGFHDPGTNCPEELGGFRPFPKLVAAQVWVPHPLYGEKLYPPSHRFHPSSMVLTEDVYYMHLLFKALACRLC